MLNVKTDIKYWQPYSIPYCMVLQYSCGFYTDPRYGAHLPPGHTIGSMMVPCPLPLAPQCQEWILDTRPHVSWIQPYYLLKLAFKSSGGHYRKGSNYSATVI